MLIFGFPGLLTLRWYMRDKGTTNMHMSFYYNYIFPIITMPYNIHEYTLI